MVKCPKSVMAPTAAAGPLSVAKVSSTWTKVCATASRIASARSRAGRELVSRSTVTAAPPIGYLWGRMPYAPPNGAMYTDRSASSALEYNAFDLLYTEWCAFGREVDRMATAQPACSEPALSTRWDPDRREN